MDEIFSHHQMSNHIWQINLMEMLCQFLIPMYFNNLKEKIVGTYHFIISTILSHLNSLHTTLVLHMSSDTSLKFSTPWPYTYVDFGIRIYSTVVFLFHFGCKHEYVMNPTVQFFNCFWLKMFLLWSAKQSWTSKCYVIKKRPILKK